MSESPRSETQNTYKRPPDPQREILNIEEAAELLGVSIKTFNKVLHGEDMPARKIGREWKFSRQALIEWVGNGRSRDFYRESSQQDGAAAPRAKSRPSGQDSPPKAGSRAGSRRTQGWRIELD